MRLIDAESETLIKQINLNFGSVNRFIVKWLLNNAPTVDAVPVVRCKDCSVPHNKWTGCPRLNGLVPPPDFYCAFGERRKEDCPNHPAPPV